MIPGDSGGPVFVRYGVDGVSIRTFDYNDDGVLKHGHRRERRPDHDDLRRPRQRDVDEDVPHQRPKCHTSYTDVPGDGHEPVRPAQRPADREQGRAVGERDRHHLPDPYTYHPSGQLATQTGSRRHVRRRTRTPPAARRRSAAAPSPPAAGRLTTNARGKITKYAYYANGDLAGSTEPSGLVTEYTYDPIGRLISKKDISDSFPAGVVSTYTYDGMSRLRTSTGAGDHERGHRREAPAARHQRPTTRTATSRRSRSADALGNDRTRTHVGGVRRARQTPDPTTDPEGGETWLDYDAFGNVAVHDGLERQQVRLRLHRAQHARRGAAAGLARVTRRALRPPATTWSCRRTATTSPGGSPARPTRWGAGPSTTYYDDGLLARPCSRSSTTRTAARATTSSRRTPTTVPVTRSGRSGANGKSVLRNVAYDKRAARLPRWLDPDGLTRGRGLHLRRQRERQDRHDDGEAVRTCRGSSGHARSRSTYDYDDADNLSRRPSSTAARSRGTRRPATTSAACRCPPSTLAATPPGRPERVHRTPDLRRTRAGHVVDRRAGVGGKRKAAREHGHADRATGYNTFGESRRLPGRARQDLPHDLRPLRPGDQFGHAVLPGAWRAAGLHPDRASPSTTATATSSRSRTRAATPRATPTTSSTGWRRSTRPRRPTTNARSRRSPTPAPANCCPLWTRPASGPRPPSTTSTGR